MFMGQTVVIELRVHLKTWSNGNGKNTNTFYLVYFMVEMLFDVKVNSIVPAAEDKIL